MGFPTHCATSAWEVCIRRLMQTWLKSGRIVATASTDQSRCSNDLYEQLLQWVGTAAQRPRFRISAHVGVFRMVGSRGGHSGRNILVWSMYVVEEYLQLSCRSSRPPPAHMASDSQVTLVRRSAGVSRLFALFVSKGC